MRKIIIILGFILLSSNYLLAQVCDKINCDDIKNYINIKIIEESVKKDPNESKLREFFEKNTIDSPAKYSEFASTLDSNDFSQTRTKLGDVINSINISKEYNKDEFASEVMKLVGAQLSEKQKKNCNFDALKTKLETDINNYISEKITDKKESEESNVKQDDYNVNNYQGISHNSVELKNPSFFSFSNFNIFILLLIFFPLILFFILLKRIKDLYSKNEKRKSHIEAIIEQFPSNQNQNNFKSTIQLSKEDFEKFLDNSIVIKEFQDAIGKLQNQVLITVPKNIDSITPTVQQILDTNANSAGIFYMKNPVENSFYNNHKSFSTENTIYKFFLKSNKSEAEFEIHTDGLRVADIISMVETLIKSGCDEDNNPLGNTSNIKTLTRGIVSLEGDKWVIKRKALIRYE